MTPLEQATKEWLDTHATNDFKIANEWIKKRKEQIELEKLRAALENLELRRSEQSTFK